MSKQLCSLTISAGLQNSEQSLILTTRMLLLTKQGNVKWTEKRGKENVHLGPVMEEPALSAREEDEEEEEEEEQALTGKEDLALRVDGTTSRDRLMGITARVGGTTRPWYSKSLKTHEKYSCSNPSNKRKILQCRNKF